MRWVLFPFGGRPPDLYVSSGQTRSLIRVEIDAFGVTQLTLTGCGREGLGGRCSKGTCCAVLYLSKSLVGM